MKSIATYPLRLIMLCLFTLNSTVALASASDSRTGNGLHQDSDAVYGGNFRPIHDRPGETAENPIVLDAFPILETGNTSHWRHDYDEACPIAGGAAPDVVYQFFNDRYRVVNVSLCESKFDTKVYVYDNHFSPGAPLACSDDGFSGSFIEDAVSLIRHLVLQESHTYYFVVDGFGRKSGEYEFTVQEIPSCELLRPTDAIDEGEIECHSDYIDHINAGCDPAGEFVTFLAPSDSSLQIWGTSGTYRSDTGYIGDSDTYELVLTEDRTLTYQLEAEFPARLSLIDVNGGCQDPEYIDQFSTGVCAEVFDSSCLTAGVYWLNVHPLHDHGAPSGVNYVLTIDGYNTARDSFTTRVMRRD